MNREARIRVWIETYADSVLHVCFLYLSDRGQAEDAAQDTWVKAWKHMEDYERGHIVNEKAWLLRIAINTCRDYQRSAWFRHVDRKQALENLPEGPINLGNKLPKIKAGQTVKRHEAPRGQLSYMLVGNDSLNNYRISIHVPSFKNTPTVPHMLRNNTVADAGLIIASIDPCFSCMDR